MDFEEQMDTEPSKEKKMMGFDCCQEYLSTSSNKILLWQYYKRKILIQLLFAD